MSRNKNKTMARTGKTATLTADEFAELPLSIQRKYFSPLERLRIAEHSTSPLLPHQPAHGLLRTKSSPTLHSPSLSRATSPRRHRPRKPEAAALRDKLEELYTESQWFLNLPEKIQRQHFSPEERCLYASRCEASSIETAIIVDDSVPAVPALPPLPPPPTDIRLPPPPPPTPLIRPNTSTVDTKSSYEGYPVPDQAVSVRYFRPEEMASCFDPSFGKRSRRPSTRRTLSLSGLSSLSLSIPPPLSHARAPSSHGLNPPHKRTTSVTPRVSESSTPAIDPTAVHYSDPEARMKLRLYLGSPQKFDEALEFGFPANHEAEVPLTADRSGEFLAPLNLSDDLQSFMKKDMLSFLDSEDDIDAHTLFDTDDHSLPDADSPATPADPDDVFRHKRIPSSQRSVESSPLLQQQQSPVKASITRADILANALSGAREMTLRMTLTRPDLRANDEERYGRDTARASPPPTDPLALEELFVSDDTTGASGPFAARPLKQSGGSWKRLFHLGRRDRR